MPVPFDLPNNEHPSTYIVQDRENQEEFVRLMRQDLLLTKSMGGVLAEQSDPTLFRRILDIGCGPGGWAIETARTFPAVSVIGIDISQRMILYARKLAEGNQVADRVEFQMMDALRLLEFPGSFFDLVNLRLGGSFLRTWDWPKILSEMRRVTRPKGIIRVIDQEIMHQSNSPTTAQINKMVLQAFFRAGYLFAEETTGLIARLPQLLTQSGCRQVQITKHALEYKAGTPEGLAYSENMVSASHTLRPFIQKWGCMSTDYDALIQKSTSEMHQPDFHATWHFHCVWGTRS